MADSVIAARTGYGALVHVLAVRLAVADVSRLAFAQEVGRQVAAFRVLHASGCYRGVLALVDI